MMTMTEALKQIEALRHTPAREVARMRRDGRADADRDNVGDEVPAYVERPHGGRVHHRRDAYLARLAERELCVRADARTGIGYVEQRS